MILKVCDRCGCEIKPKNNNPSAIKFGWVRYSGDFTNKAAVEPFDLCNTCMEHLMIFLGCEPKRIGMKDTLADQEKEIIKKEINETLERVKKLQEKHAK